MARINLPRSRFVKNPEPQAKYSKVCWHEVREQVGQVNPTLADLIDALDPSYPLNLKQYDYGFVIANHEALLEPSLVLDKNFELFFEYHDQAYPHEIYQPGEIIFAGPVFESSNWLYQHTCWKLTAGCRSLFMLPKITEYLSHAALLRQYKISIKKPLKLEEHWDIFKLIANSNVHHEKENPWQATLLSFTESWLAHRHDPAWLPFYHHLDASTMAHLNTAQQKPWLEMLFGILQREKNIKLALPKMEQSLHLILLALGDTPGFRPADNAMLPIHLINEAYLEHYKLKEYAPIIMGPDYLKGTESLYYSYNHPTAHFISPETNSRKSLVQSMLNLNWTFNKIRDLILNKNFVLETSPLRHAMQNCHFDFYHDEAKHYPPFKHPEDILKDDVDFMQDWPHHKLQSHSHFLNGCVWIKRKNI